MRLARRRLIELLLRWPAPWLLALEDAALDVFELDKTVLPAPLERLAATGIAVLQSSQTPAQFNAHYFWSHVDAANGPEAYRQRQAQALALLNERYARDGVEEALNTVRRIHAEHPYPELVREYARQAAEEKRTGKPTAWTAARKTLYNFWEDYVRNIDVSTDGGLGGFWKYRAEEYVKLNEVLDAANYYRWRMDLQKNKVDGEREYGRRRPDSYTKLSRQLGINVDVAAKYEGEVKQLVVEVVSNGPAQPLQPNSTARL